MTRPLPTTALLCAALAALLCLASCRGAAPQMNFYTLPPAEALPAGARADGPSVGVGPLVIPRTIDRPHIVTRETDNRLRLAEFQRWAGPLGDEVLAALTRTLAARLGSEEVLAYPWSEFKEPDFRVPVEIQRLDGRLGGKVVLEATWGVAAPGERQARAVHAFRTAVPTADAGYPALVDAHAKALEELGGVIATEIQGMRGK
ncbi:PqiC family protein [Desulfocurvus sp. DL9XJH121]